jgi:glycerophosphoryl diester phosphodiesterase
MSAESHYTRKTLIAHRGASAYAPEHTMAAYRRALQQGADYVEQDLQITKDGVLVCLHDLTLERTTNVEEVFPDRVRTLGPSGVKMWYVSDFTLAEIKRLDAGSWFDAKFSGERVPTWQEAIDLVRGKAGLYPETKGPEVYGSRGFNMEALVMATLKKNRLDQPGADPKTPVIIQSFSPQSLEKMRRMEVTLPLILLITESAEGHGVVAGDAGEGMAAGESWLTDHGLRLTKEFADGIGPAKSFVSADPSIVTRAHALGLTVTPYTFRSRDVAPGQTVKDEMAKFLYEFGVDALFTDNPDQFPRR